jgi:hypothetical protein
MILLVFFGILFFLGAAALKRRHKSNYVLAKTSTPSLPGGFI